MRKQPDFTVKSLSYGLITNFENKYTLQGQGTYL